MPKLSPRELGFLDRAIEISQRSLKKGGTPFGAIVVVDGQVAGEGESRVVELVDPTAHAEVMALRDASKKTGSHLIEDGVMFASSEPCPMCLAACYWARIPKIVYGATSTDVATSGFEDVWFYREIAKPAQDRAMAQQLQVEDRRERAARVLRSWVDGLPDPVQPKR